MKIRGSHVFAAIAVVSLATACHSNPSDRPPVPSPNLGTAFTQSLPANIMSLPLQEANGSMTTLSAFKGEPVMIADFLTLCTDICPLITANTVAMSRALTADHDKVALLEISVDPHRDTPYRLRAYEKLYGGPRADWTLLRATPANTKILMRALGVAYGRQKESNPPAIDWLTHKPLTYDVYHEDALIFLDASGQERFVINSTADTQGNYPPTRLAKFLDKQGARALTHPNLGDAWTVKQALSVFAWILGKPVPDAT